MPVIHATRQVFKETELSENLKPSLQKKTRQTREHFDHGSQIFYKWNGDQKWKGPGNVAGHDDALYLLDM